MDLGHSLAAEPTEACAANGTRHLVARSILSLLYGHLTCGTRLGVSRLDAVIVIASFHTRPLAMPLLLALQTLLVATSLSLTNKVVFGDLGILL